MQRIVRGIGGRLRNTRYPGKVCSQDGHERIYLLLGVQIVDVEIAGDQYRLRRRDVLLGNEAGQLPRLIESDLDVGLSRPRVQVCAKNIEVARLVSYCL